MSSVFTSRIQTRSEERVYVTLDAYLRLGGSLLKKTTPNMASKYVILSAAYCTKRRGPRQIVTCNSGDREFLAAT